MGIELLIGLGNPGRKYSRTRHNIGFVVLDRLANDYGFEIKKSKFKGKYCEAQLFGKKICCLKPMDYMNRSGEVVDSFVNYFKVDFSSILIVHDDIDLPLGKLRFSYGSGHGGHNGIRSILDWIYTKDFYRLRIGVGRPTENIDSADYVLSAFTSDEKKVASEAVEKAVEAIMVFYTEGFKTAMMLFNKKID